MCIRDSSTTPSRTGLSTTSRRHTRGSPVHRSGGAPPGGITLRRSSVLTSCGSSLVEQEFGGRGGYFSHLGDDGALASVVVNPFLVELGLRLGEPPVDGLAVDLGGPLKVRAMQLRRVAVAVAVRFAAAVVSLSQASGSDVADVGELGGEVAVPALVTG